MFHVEFSQLYSPYPGSPTESHWCEPDLSKRENLMTALYLAPVCIHREHMRHWTWACPASLQASETLPAGKMSLWQTYHYCAATRWHYQHKITVLIAGVFSTSFSVGGSSGCVTLSQDHKNSIDVSPSFYFLDLNEKMINRFCFQSYYV